MRNKNIDRRKIVSTVATSCLLGLSGCMSDDSNIQDSDGDGVIDSEDYAPQDPDVQEESDVSSDLDQDDEPVGSDDPEINLVAACDNDDVGLLLEYSWEGASGEESDTGGLGTTSIPGDATYVEAKLDITSAPQFASGLMELELISNGTTIDEDSDSVGTGAECNVEGRTQ